MNHLALSRIDAESMVMAARLNAGWVTEEDLAPPVEESPEGELPVEDKSDAETVNRRSVVAIDEQDASLSERLMLRRIAVGLIRN